MTRAYVNAQIHTLHYSPFFFSKKRKEKINGNIAIILATVSDALSIVCLAADIFRIFTYESTV